MTKRTIITVNFILLPIIFCLGLFGNVVAQEEQKNPLTVQLITTQNPISEGEPTTWYVTVSPAITESIKSVSFQSVADGQWQWQEPLPPQIDTLTSTQSFTITAVPLIPGELTPILNVSALVNTRHYSFFATSKESVIVIPIPENNTSSQSFTLSDRSWEMVVIFVSVSLSAVITFLVTLGTQWWKDRQEREGQKQKHKGQVYGILFNVCTNTKYAAENLSLADISILNDLFKNEGLYDVIYDYDLASSVEDVWAKSEAHNFGLDKPGGFERATALKEATADLLANLKKLR